VIACPAGAYAQKIDDVATKMKKIILEKIRFHLLPVIVLSFISFIVYANSFHNSFLLNWDDNGYVIQNEAAHGLTAEHLKAAFTRFYVGNYAPVQIISYMVDYSLWGLRPGGFIFTNVLLHVVNGVLFYALLFRLTRRRLPGFLAAFIFLLHPVQVESVAWISQRKNLLAMFFFLAAFHSYISYRADEKNRSKLFYALSVLAFALALLSKSVAVVLPLVLVLYDLCYLAAPRRKRWVVDKIPYVVAAGAAAILALNSQQAAHGGGRMSYHIEGSLAVFYTMLTVLVRYFKLIFWPSDLSAMYMMPVRLQVDAAVAWAGLFAVFLVVLGIYLYRRRKEFFFWYALFFVGLLPVSQVVPLVTLMNDRYLYFPMLGAAACYGLLALSASQNSYNIIRKSGSALFLILLIIPLPWLSWERTSVWSNDLSLWKDTVDKNPGSTLALNGLGMSYVDEGKFDDAEKTFLEALSIDPEYEFALGNIGALYNSTGKLAAARPYLLKAVGLFPANFNALMNLGINYYLSHDFQNAELTFKKALALQPYAPDVLSRLGDVYLRMRKPDLAGRYYTEAASVGGRTAYLEYNLACVEALNGRPREAIEHLTLALKMGYNDFQHLAKDPALDGLRARADFQLLVHTYVSR
jgi:Flp pilus assembly protein TadD